MQVAPANVRTYIARRGLYSGTRGPWLEHLVEDEAMPLEDAISLLSMWELIPVIDEPDGHIGTFLKRNKEVHFAFYRRFRNKGKVTVRRLITFLKPLLDAEIFLVTKLAQGEDHRFIERLGFQELGGTIDGAFRTYILNDITMPGNRHAQV